MSDSFPSRPSAPDLWRAVPATWKLVVGVLGAIGALWGIGYGAGATTARVYAEAATKTYVREQITAEVTAAVTKCDRKALPDSASCRVEDIEHKHAAEALAAEQVSRDRRTVERAMMKRLVSYDAVDKQPDRRRKMLAAETARSVFAKQCERYVTAGSCDGMSLEDAAAYALDAR